METFSLLIGFFVACLVTATGIGGGILLTPLLIVVLRIPPIVAVGTALVFMSITKASATVLHWRQKTVDFQLGSCLLLGSIPGAFAGAETLALLQAGMGQEVNGILRVGIGICLIGLSFFSLILDGLRNRSWLLQKDKDRDGVVERHERKNAIAIGFAGGFLVSATSVGSGSLIILLLLICCKRRAAVLVGTDIFHGMVLTLVAALLHFQVGSVDLHLLARLFIGSIPGVIIGIYISSLVRPFSLRTALLIFGVLGGFVMIL